MEGEKTNRLMMKQIEIRITFLHIGRGYFTGTYGEGIMRKGIHRNQLSIMQE